MTVSPSLKQGDEDFAKKGVQRLLNVCIRRSTKVELGLQTSENPLECEEGYVGFVGGSGEEG